MHRPYSVAVEVDAKDARTKEVTTRNMTITVSARNEANATRLVQKHVKGCRPFDSWKGGPNAT